MGAIVDDAASIDATSDRTSPVHTSSGDLAGQASVVVGTGIKLGLHAAEGILPDGTSSVAGSAVEAAQVAHTSSGVLAAIAASTASTAMHQRLHAAAGALSAAAAAVVGAAIDFGLFTVVGALETTPAIVAGVARHGIFARISDDPSHHPSRPHAYQQTVRPSSTQTRSRQDAIGTGRRRN
jgi:hypothetical protein